ncbi:MAG: four helix bundle protein [bacterium]
MANVEKFEDLDIWIKARNLANAIFDQTEKDRFSKDFGLKDQIQRAATSVMSNIAEGFEREGDKEFIRFLSTALGSVGEVRSQLYLAYDRNYLSEETFEELKKCSLELTRMIKSFMRYLSESNHEGKHYRNK